MKIHKVHIENFGKLHQFELTFEEGVNKIVEDNGFGKTTLAMFIKAMFYGLPSTRKTNIDENERKKYKPWQGGNFGGYLDFEVENNVYRIERFFGQKDGEDIFNLIDLKTGKTSNKYTSNIGEELFDLDSESYQRSTFIPQKELANGITDNLSSKLIAMIHGTERSDSLNSALAIIDKRRQELKKKGNAGKIAEVEDKINETLEKIDLLKHNFKAMEMFQQQEQQQQEIINQIEKEKEEVDIQIQQFVEYQKVVANQKYIQENENIKKDLEDKIREYKNFTGGQDILNTQLEEYKEKNKELSLIYQKIQALEEDNSLHERQEFLTDYFNQKLPNEEEIGEALNKQEKLVNLKNMAELSKRDLQSSSADKKSLNKWIFLPISLFVAFLIAGCFLVSSHQTIGIIAFALAFISMTFAGFVYLKNMIDKKTSYIGEHKKYEAVNNDLEIMKLEKEIDEFLSLFPVDNTENKITALYDVLNKRKEMDLVDSKIASFKEKKNQLFIQCDLLTTELEQYFAQFNLPNQLNYEEKLVMLKNLKTDYNKNVETLEIVTNKLKEFEKISFENMTYDFDDNTDINQLQNLSKTKQEEIDKSKQRQTKLLQKIEDIKLELDSLDEYENNLEILRLTKENLTKELKTIKFAETYLKQANDNLSAKYLMPMKMGFEKYLNLIVGENDRRFRIDTDLKVTFEEYGETHEFDYLSKGYQGVVDLCVRFALVDALFTKEKPFLIFDDPFVNMDKQKIEKVLGLLNNISTEYQIIYMVCHQSRS